MKIAMHLLNTTVAAAEAAPVPLVLLLQQMPAPAQGMPAMATCPPLLLLMWPGATIGSTDMVLGDRDCPPEYCSCSCCCASSCRCSSTHAFMRLIRCAMNRGAKQAPSSRPATTSDTLWRLSMNLRQHRAACTEQYSTALVIAQHGLGDRRGIDRSVKLCRQQAHQPCSTHLSRSTGTV